MGPYNGIRIAALIWNISQALTVGHKYRAILVQHWIVRHGGVITGRQVRIASFTNQCPFNQRVNLSKCKLRFHQYFP